MRLFLMTFLCLTLFASNSILCRGALVTWHMEPFQYTALRALSAAAMLAAFCVFGIIRAQKPAPSESGERTGSVWRGLWEQSSWLGAASLFTYMMCFSLGYVDIPSAAGTLIINVSVQFCMVGWGIANNDRPGMKQTTGLAIALAGLVALMLPGLTAPPLLNSFLMMGSGLAWGVYSLVGRRSSSAALATAGNFIRCIPAGIAAGAIAFCTEHAPELPAVACALAAGGLASAMGYILWYVVVPRYSLVSSSIIQLSVPIITAVLAVAFLAETITLRLVLCSVLILGGIGLAVVSRKAS